MFPDGQLILAFFQGLTEIPPLEWAHAIRFFKGHQLKKGEKWFTQGEMFPYVGALTKGIVYSYYEDTEGQIGVKRFVTPGLPVAPYPSIVTETPSNYSLRALEDSSLFYIHYSDFKKLMARHICWERAGRLTLEKEVMSREQKEYELFMLSPEERYKAFFSQYSGIIDKIPQYLIASYIGITPEALSRIRSRLDLK